MSRQILKLVTYNVRYFGHALRGLASTRRSKRGIAQRLVKLDSPPDVICLQEVETASVRSNIIHRRAHPEQTQLESFMDEFESAWAIGRESPFPYEAFYFPAHIYRFRDVPVYTTGLAIIVNVRTLRVDEHNAAAPQHITYHHVRQMKDRKQSRICAHMSLETADGKLFHIFNTHLSLPTPFSRRFWMNRGKMGYGINQLQEARALASFMSRRANGRPFIVVGDFNSPPGSPVYEFLKGQAGLIVAQEALGLIDGKQSRAFPTAGFMRSRMHLDHVFCDSQVSWVDMSDTAPFGKREAPFHGLSDHVPLIARFAL